VLKLFEHGRVDSVTVFVAARLGAVLLLFYLFVHILIVLHLFSCQRRLHTFIVIQRFLQIVRLLQGLRRILIF
jgi:hypothetical protein